MILEVAGTLETTTKVKYLRMLVHGELLRQYDSMSNDVESANHLTVESIILGLGSHFSLLIGY